MGGLGAYLGGLGTWETCLGPFDMATRRCFIDRINVDRRKVLPAGTLFCRQGHSRIVPQTVLALWGSQLWLEPAKSSPRIPVLAGIPIWDPNLFLNVLLCAYGFYNVF